MEYVAKIADFLNEALIAVTECEDDNEADCRSDRGTAALTAIGDIVRHSHISPKTGAVLVTLKDGREYEITVRRVAQ